jgi:hypothetical protein
VVGSKSARRKPSYRGPAEKSLDSFLRLRAALP